MPGYIWKEEKGAYDSSLLGCKLDCARDPYSQKIVDPANLTACLCKPGYFWDNSTTTESRCHINCGLIPYTQGPLNFEKCICVFPYAWNA